MSRIRVKEEATVPPTPASGYIVFYAKTDGLLYFKDDTGAEFAVKGGAALTDIDTLAKLNAVVTDATLVNAADIAKIGDTTVAGFGWVLDEDNMVSDDATKVPTQQSVKAYVDAVGPLYLPLAGGTMTGNIVMSGAQTVDGRDLSADGSKLDGIEALADVTDATNVAAAGAVMDSDFSGAEGFMRKTGAGTYEVIKSNLTATTDPGTGNDSTEGYAAGSIWLNTTTDIPWFCLDNSAGAAVWSSGGGAGGLTPVFVSGSHTAAAGEAICALPTTAAATIPITLPAGNDGDQITIDDFQDSAATYNITITPNGAETVDGDTSYTINVNGGGVKLVYQASSTDWRVAYRTPGASSNYSEGTFTPTIQDASLSDAEGQTYSAQSGRYVKIGSLVNFWIDLTLSSKGTLTASEQVYVAGLPFLPNGVAGVSGVAYANNLSITATESLSGVIGFNTAEDVIRLYNWSSAGGIAWLLLSEVGATSRLIIQGSYTTDE